MLSLGDLHFSLISSWNNIVDLQVVVVASFPSAEFAYSDLGKHTIKETLASAIYNSTGQDTEILQENNFNFHKS